MAPKRLRPEQVEEELRAFGLALPEATESFPWGERALKVRGKTFLFMRLGPPELGLSVKLPHSGLVALVLPFASPTGYGLGKSGWVSARFPRAGDAPLELLRSWIEESYRAVAPKKLGAQLRAAAAPLASAAPAGGVRVRHRTTRTAGPALDARPARKSKKTAASPRRTR